jgi:hypothetical protein
MSMGSVKAGTAFPTPAEAYDESPLSIKFSFGRITNSFSDATGQYQATFWVTSDALKWQIPATERYAVLLDTWNKEKQEPDPSDDSGAMLVRLPCSATQNQEIAKRITTHPDPVKTGAVDGLINHVAPVRADMTPLPSLLLTPKLSDLRWAQAKAQIRHCNQDTDKPIVGETAKLNKCVNEQIRAFMNKSGSTNSVPTIGDPGKIWAITNDVYADRVATGKTKTGATYTYPYKAAINYGWHGPSANLLAVTPGQKVMQSVGARHDSSHLDYSQSAILIAGWCEVTEPNKPVTFMRTEAVYRSKTLCRLVTHDAIPLTVTSY